MPDLVGRPLPLARRMLEENGFRVGNVRVRQGRSESRGRVLRQFPLPGYLVSSSDMISLVVGE